MDMSARALWPEGAMVFFADHRFCSWFAGKVEGPTENASLQSLKLMRCEYDQEIIRVLGGVAKVTSSLGDVFYLLGQQRNGVKGVLLTDNQNNVFFVDDVFRNLRAIALRWNKIHWCISAGDSEFDESSSGVRVFIPLLHGQANKERKD